MSDVTNNQETKYSLQDLLYKMVELDATDLHLTVGTLQFTELMVIW